MLYKYVDTTQYMQNTHTSNWQLEAHCKVSTKNKQNKKKQFSKPCEQNNTEIVTLEWYLARTPVRFELIV